MDISKTLNNLILKYAKAENELLFVKLDMGIFDMPELAFVYEVGKQIALSKLEYLGSDDYTWMRETNFGNGGPTDLAFIAKDKTHPNFAFEFKFDNKDISYKKDIDKLIRPFGSKWNDAKWKKYFCALKWTLNQEQGQKFMETLSKIFPNSTTLIGQESFKTKVQNKKDQYCHFSFWEIS